MVKPTIEVKATTPTEREVLPVAVRSVQLDQVTHTRRYWIVTLDPAIVPQDVTDRPDLWRLVQAQRPDKCLGPNDHVELRGSGFTIFATVNEIDADGQVFFYNIKNVQRPSRTAELYDDGSYKIAAIGTHFCVHRKRDGLPAQAYGGKIFQTIDQARAFIREQYATRVA
jgi:hypothetical protein